MTQWHTFVCKGTSGCFMSFMSAVYSVLYWLYSLHFRSQTRVPGRQMLYCAWGLLIGVQTGYVRSPPISAESSRGQTTVENCIGGHVHVLSDYKKTWPSKILKIVHSNCHHLIDILTKFYQNHISSALLNRPDVRCLSILTKIAMYSCAHVAHSRKIPINPSAS